MKTSIKQKLNNLAERYDEISALLAEPEIQNDQNRYRTLSQEYAQLEPVVGCYQSYQHTEEEIDAASEMLSDDDPELRDLAQEYVSKAEQQQQTLEPELQTLLLPKDPNDKRNIFLEIRAGTGGAEAALFAGDLARRYQRYAENQGWRTEMISESPGEHGGYKEMVVRITGQGVYSRLKFESGAHRVQRVPETESQGRIACTVGHAVRTKWMNRYQSDQLRIDTRPPPAPACERTDSAVRTHLPSIVVNGTNVPSTRKAPAPSPSSGQAALAEQENRTWTGRNRKLVAAVTAERIRTYFEKGHRSPSISPCTAGRTWRPRPSSSP